MDSGCQSRFRKVHQKSRSAILHRFLRDDRRRQEKDVSSGPELGRPLRTARVVDGLLGGEQVTGVLYRGGVIKLPRARFARRRREIFGDVDCKSLHLCPEIV